MRPGSDFRFPAAQGARGWRAVLSVGLGAVLLLGGARPLQAQEKIDEALKKATGYLLTQQQPSGAIHSKERNETAMTSLALLALASCGHQPGDPTPEGRAMRRALAYVLRPEGQTADGYFGQTDGSRMYGHGIATLMLAEMQGMGFDAAQDELIATKTRRGIDLILRAQKVAKNDANAGGWRYSPDAGDSDMSVTVWQTMALRAAKNAGLDVPGQAIADAVKYMKGLYSPEGDKRGRGKPGGFGYQGASREISTTAEGLLAMQVCGEYGAEETLGAADRLLSTGVRQGEKWFFYTCYYYAQGMYQRGGKHAAEGARFMPELLLPLQSREGWWEGMNGDELQGGKVYATALAVLSLAVKNHYLPIYQR